jgi:uncharacterized protein (DUF885 family)
MKIEIFSLALPAFLGCWVANAADIAAESKRANDIRQFHDVVLTNGALPLDVLEDLVNRWIKSKQS